MGAYLPGTGPGHGGLVWGWDSTPEMSVLNFYLPHVPVGPAPSLSVQLLLVSLGGHGVFNSVVIKLPFK